ncbi:MAG: hypothetical protein KJN87_05500, partial [Desulfofustis sp.]|nr:hypothetical protein [Desulfofustis sp.]
KQAREKVGAHYSRMEEENSEDPSNAEDTPEPPENDPEDDWIADLAGDPYVTESEMIINDLVQLLRN